MAAKTYKYKTVTVTRERFELTDDDIKKMIEDDRQKQPDEPFTDYKWVHTYKTFDGGMKTVEYTIKVNKSYRVHVCDILFIVYGKHITNIIYLKELKILKDRSMTIPIRDIDAMIETQGKNYIEYMRDKFRKTKFGRDIEDIVKEINACKR